MSDIFCGSIEVSRVKFPSGGFGNPWEKKEWAERALRNVVTQSHGRRYWAVVPGGNAEKLTGTSVEVTCNDDKKIVYAIIEPISKIDDYIIIVKKEVDDVDEIKAFYQYRFEQRNDSKVNSSPFAKLQEIREKLPLGDNFMRVTVGRNFKTGKPILAPQYPENDPVVGGPSMRIFHQTSSEEIIVGEVWKAIPVSEPIVAGKNKRDVPMVHIDVKLLKRIL